MFDFHFLYMFLFFMEIYEFPMLFHGQSIFFVPLRHHDEKLLTLI